MADHHPAGWLVNPEDPTTWRYWDGERWTADTAPREAGEVPIGPPPPNPVSTRSLATTSPPPSSATAPTKSPGIARLLGRKTPSELAAETSFHSLLDEMSSGRAHLHGLAQRLRDAAEAGAVRPRKAGKLQAQAFRTLAARQLADDILTREEELEVLEVANALGYDQATLQAQFLDVMEHLLIASVNDGRLPIVYAPKMITKADEVVHLEVAAALMKEVVRREYRGGGSGVSVPIGLGMRVNTGGFRGRSVVVGSSLEAADQGVLSVTNRRAVFHGQRKTQESRLDRLVSLEAFNDGVRLGVSNRQTASLFRVANGPIVAAMINGALQHA